MMLYPHNTATFRPALAQEAFANVVEAIVTQGNEDVLVFTPQEYVAQAQSQLAHIGSRAKVIACPSNDSWARDTGPTILVKTNNGTKSLVGLDWEFNAYGGLYSPYDLDQQIATNMCAGLGSTYSITVPPDSIDMVLEGGSIHTDGEGTVLTTDECLLHFSRNGDLTREQVFAKVLAATNCTTLISIPHGLDGDSDTHGHVDNIACFAGPGRVLLSWTDETDDKNNYEICRQAKTYLEASVDAMGRRIEVIPLHLPYPPLVSSCCLGFRV